MTFVPTNRLNTAESVTLDVVRISAAVVVAYGHFTQSVFTTGFANRTGTAVACVAVFFVLSGFVVRYVTRRRASTFGGYLADRASRIYSVALPALLITWLFDTIARHADPAFYAVFLHPQPEWFQLGLNAVFAGQLWNLNIAPLSNAPYWSINYEVLYYLIYGCYFYLRGWSRWVSTLVLCVIAGPHLLALFPLWIIGCIAHDLYQRWKIRGSAALYLNRILLSLAVAAAMSFVLARTLHWLAPLAVLYRSLEAADHELITLRGALFGLAWTLLFLRVLAWMQGYDMRETSPHVRAIRFLSEGTFPIYLLHFPVLVLLAACVPYPHENKLVTLTLLGLILCIGILLGHPANLFKRQLREFTGNRAH